MAGFFALLYATLGLGSIIHDDINTTMYKKESKEKALKNNDFTYSDGHGNEYYIDTDTRCETVVDARTGHRVIRELNKKGAPSRILYDYDAISNIRKKLEFEEAINKAQHWDKKYFAWRFEHQGVPGSLVFTGYEISTKRKYIVTEVCGEYWMYYLADSQSKRFLPNGIYEDYYKVLFDTGKTISREEFYERSYQIN